MQTLHGRGKNSHVALFPQAYPNVHWWPLDDVTFAASFLHLENISWAIQADIAILNQGMTVTTQEGKELWSAIIHAVVGVI